MTEFMFCFIAFIVVAAIWWGIVGMAEATKED